MPHFFKGEDRSVESVGKPNIPCCTVDLPFHLVCIARMQIVFREGELH